MNSYLWYMANESLLVFHGSNSKARVSPTE